MLMNSGKVFENDFASSLPSYCFKHRLRDSAQSFLKQGNMRFAWNNECDFLIFDTLRCKLFAVELKSTKYKSMSIQTDENDTENKMIKYHQIKSLTEFMKYDNVIPCFVLNFRDEQSNSQRTYYIHIKDFNQCVGGNGKKSINEIDIINNSGIKIDGILKRTHYLWQIDDLLNKI